jgi:hypothetical protein
MGRAFRELVDAVPPCPASTPPTGSSSASTAGVFETGVAGSGKGAKVTGGKVTGARVGAGSRGVVAVEDSTVLEGDTCVAVSAVGSVEPASVVAVSDGKVVTPPPRTVVVVIAGRREAEGEIVVVCADAALTAPRKERAESAPAMTTDLPRLVREFAGCAEFDR